MKLLVEYADGNKVELQSVASFKPVEENTMNFSEAVKAMKIGNNVRRLKWKTEGYIRVENVSGGKGTHILLCYTSPNDPAPSNWSPVLDDLEAEDWWLVV